MSKKTKQEQPEVELNPDRYRFAQVEGDRGCGGVILMLDHSTGNITGGSIGTITIREVRGVLRAFLNQVENELDNQTVAAQEQLEALLREQMPVPTGPPPVV